MFRETNISFVLPPFVLSLSSFRLRFDRWTIGKEILWSICILSQPCLFDQPSTRIRWKYSNDIRYNDYWTSVKKVTFSSCPGWRAFMVGVSRNESQFMLRIMVKNEAAVDIIEANVSSDSSMNFPAVKRTGFWPLTISMFTGFCKLRGYRYQGIEYPAWPIASLWEGNLLFVLGLYRHPFNSSTCLFVFSETAFRPLYARHFCSSSAFFPQLSLSFSSSSFLHRWTTVFSSRSSSSPTFSSSTFSMPRNLYASSNFPLERVSASKRCSLSKRLFTLSKLLAVTFYLVVDEKVALTDVWCNWQ